MKARHKPFKPGKIFYINTGLCLTLSHYFQVNSYPGLSFYRKVYQEDSFDGFDGGISRDLGGNTELLAFYRENEPEGRSVPPEKMQALKESRIFSYRQQD